MRQRVEFDCHTRSPLNGSQGISRGARFLDKKYKDEQRAATLAALRNLRWPERFVDLPGRGRVANRWRVVLTRIAIGVMDPGALGGAFKAIQDEIAEWAGEKDERKPPWASWSYQQEQPTEEKFGDVARQVYRVRIEWEDGDTCEGRVVELAETHAAGRAAATRTKRAITQAAKGKRSRPTVGDLRAAAERALSPRAPHPQRADECDCDGVLHFKGGQGCVHERPVTRSPRAQAMFDKLTKINGRGPNILADPGEERAACMLADGSRCCGVAISEPCKEDGRPFAFGVHRERARGAGIVGTWEDGSPKLCGYLRKADGSCCKHGPTCGALRPTGPRKLATVRPVECWARLPWAACKTCGGDGRQGACEGPCCDCPACDGLGGPLVRWVAAEEKGAPAEVAFPLEAHRHAWGEVCGACHGRRGEVIDDGLEMPYDRLCKACQGHGRVLRMIRRPWRRAGEVCWLYEPAT